MKLMEKFEMNVLNNLSYGQLTGMGEKLVAAIDLSVELRDSYTANGELLLATGVNTEISRINENSSMVRLAIISKEDEALTTSLN